MTAGAPPVRALHPDVRVTLTKLVRRGTINGTTPTAERFQQTKRQIDLTPLLSDLAGTVHTTKSVRSPAGAFSLTFSDRPSAASGALETLYGLIEPMDGIEIRLSHNQRNRQPPVVMRGFVSRISRSAAVDAEGRPLRAVTVEGHDYGKVWQMLQILTRPWYTLGDVWLRTFRLFARFGLGFRTEMPAAEFFNGVFEKIINPHLAGMLPADWPMPKAITPECSVTEGLTSVTGPQNAEGPIYTILAHFLDVSPGFNEMFIEDREDAVVAILRPNPALDIDGTPIQPSSAAQSAFDRLPASDIVSLELARSDENVANYYWVQDARFELVRDGTNRVHAATNAQRETVFLERYPNSQASIYGLRALEVASQMGGGASFQGGQTPEVTAQRDGDVTRWLDARRRILSQTNRDNVLLETGAARIAGNERIRPGQHIVIGEGALAALYYVSAVNHDFVPFKGFFTTLSLERGQGFVARIQAGNAVSPYLIELGAGAPASTAPGPRVPSLGQT